MRDSVIRLFIWGQEAENVRSCSSPGRGSAVLNNKELVRLALFMR